MDNFGLAVIGLGFGDEGKGLVTDYLCSLVQKTDNPWVIRYSGGQQAGHTVYYKDFSHVFSNFGSGTLRGVPTYWAPTCTVDPIGIINELGVLNRKGIEPRLVINENCPVTTPYDVYYTQTNSRYLNIGTVGVGVGATFQREADFYHLFFGDLYFPSVLKIKLKMIEDYYNNKSENKLLCPSDAINKFSQCVEVITKLSSIKPGELEKKVFPIFEGSQGLLLDQNIGFFPFVTRSNTGLPTPEPTVFLVTRAYQTRHGSGPMTNELIPHNIKKNPDETNKLHKFQGEFRRTILDLDLLQYSIHKSKAQIDRERVSNINLVITCLDHIENEWKFTYQNELICCTTLAEFIDKIKDILQIKSIYISRSPYSENLTQLH